VSKENKTVEYHFPSIESYEKIAFNFGNGDGGIRPYHLSDIENDPNIFINELNDPEVSEISVVGFIKTSISRDIYLAHTKKEIESLKQRVMNGDLLHNIKNEVDAGLSSEMERGNAYKN